MSKFLKDSCIKKDNKKYRLAIRFHIENLLTNNDKSKKIYLIH
jgi:hypothetical protein